MLFTFLFSILFLTLILLIIIPSEYKYYIQITSLLSSSIAFILSTIFLVNFDLTKNIFQIIKTYTLSFNYFNIEICLGFDGVSILFFVLSSFLIFLCTLYIWDDIKIREYSILLVILNILLLLVFTVLDIFFFFIFFEAILIPMFILIGVWGSRERKIRAVYFIFYYTFLGSLFMLLAIIYIYINLGTLNYELISAYKFTDYEQYFLWFAFFLSFASKIPVFPFHIWLPEAHVEAPTVGSVLLAGILLKLGVYGLIRFNLTLFPEASIFFSPFVYLLCTLGVLYGSFTATRQTDLKRMIAYSSVAHMNLVTLGIFSFNVIGLEGALLQSISHGFVSSALFFLIGMLYHRYHSKILNYYSGLVHTMPLFSIILLIFTLANIALPGTSSFIGEFLILLGLSKINIICTIVSATSVILAGGYSLWLYNRIIFGNLKISNTLLYKDLFLKEFIILFPLILLTIIVGVYPNCLIVYLEGASIKICLLYFGV